MRGGVGGLGAETRCKKLKDNPIRTRTFLFALLGPASNNFFYIFELYYHTGVGTPKISNLGKAIVIDLERKKERKKRNNSVNCGHYVCHAAVCIATRAAHALRSDQFCAGNYCKQFCDL
jgi:hypothetical protein